MKPTVEPQRHLLGLDIVRFWAAGLVAAYHLAFWSWASPIDLPYRASAGRVHIESLAPFTWFGWVGVETFFVISGFVICASAKQATPCRFLRGRIARLYPAVWICASLTAAVSLGLGLAPVDETFAAYLRAMAIDPSGPWIDTVYRTLIIEGIFYILILMLLVCRGFRHIEAVAMLLGAYSLAFWLAAPFADVRHLAPAAILNFSKYGIFFALGMMICIAQERGLSRSRAVVLAALSFCGAFEVDLNAINMQAFAPHALPIVAVIVWLASVLAILWSAMDHLRIARLLRGQTRAIRTIGLMTYPLYLLHDVVGAAVLRSAAFIGQVPALGLAFVVSLAAAFAIVRLEPLIRRPLEACFDVAADRLRRLARAFAHRRVFVGATTIE